MNNIQVVTFDADDTLWQNENFFLDSRIEYSKLLEKYISHEETEALLSKCEIDNLPLYGYGIRPFMLSMLETATKIAGDKLTPELILELIEMGKKQLNHPLILLDGVEETILALKNNYKLAVATKGDLLDQGKKLKKSELMHHFHHVEIMSEKKTENYEALLDKLGCKPENFLMIGNSLRSDIMPVLELGGHAIHVPYSVTWDYEVVEGEINHPNFKKVDNIKEVLAYLL